MAIKVDEISAIIKKQIENYQTKTDEQDIGKVVSVGDGIALVYGLKDAMLSELVDFGNNVYGMVMNLNEDSVGCVIFENDVKVEEGDIVKRTKKVVEVPVGDNLIGRVVNSLGVPIDNLGEIKYEKTRQIERVAPGVMKRKSVDTPLETGIKAIDAMIPIGRGQRELIIGDRQVGKTAIAIDTIINQKGKNCLCIYVSIGQKTSSVVRIVEKLKQYGAMEYTTVVASTSSELDSMKYIAPYAGMAMAEEWMEQGKDVLIVFDDLSKHAVSYRTLSLLLKRSPGREAYPGDIFYIHSRLLERACRLNKENGGGSITALPIIETLSGDISAYIPTNVISITDGQIFLMTDLFNLGQRPAIDSGLSVSRVGSAAQFKGIKQVSKSLKIQLANYNELLSFSQFGSDLDESTKKVLTHGKVLMELLKQDQYKPMSFLRQVVELYAGQNGYLDNIEVSKVRETCEALYTYLSSSIKDVLAEIDKTKEISKENEEKLKEGIIKFCSSIER